MQLQEDATSRLSRVESPSYHRGAVAPALAIMAPLPVGRWQLGEAADVSVKRPGAWGWVHLAIVAEGVRPRQ
jgi:hypothetical protein